MSPLQSPSLEVVNGAFASEVKYLLSRSLAGEVRDWARENLLADPNGGGLAADSYQITSLYLDTPNFDVLHRNGSYARGKYRIRRYGESGSVFVERKRKRYGLVGKRRAEVSIHEIGCLASEAPNPTWPGYWFHRRLQARKLAPVCQVSYNRIARMAMTPARTSGPVELDCSSDKVTGYAIVPVRLTLDDTISVIPASRFEFSPDGDAMALSNDWIILELKYRFGMPDLFCELIRRFSLSAEPSSKYQMAGVALGLGLEEYA